MNDQNWDAERRWLEALEKVELHLHLEGSIPHEALWQLIQKYGGDPDVPDLAALETRFRYRDFPHFIETWIWKNSFLREYEDLSFIAEAVARDLAAQNIVYAESFYSPSDFSRHGLEPAEQTAAIRRGLDRVPEIRVALVADMVRDFGPEAAARTFETINEARQLGVIGIGIGGSEQLYPPEPFAAVYSRARDLGFKTSAHAGEAAGPESVWGAIRALEVDRIGHGIRSVEDCALMDHLAESRIPLEVCPLSNVRTGVVPAIEAHPVRRLFEHGLAISINSDDPKMFGTDLAGELLALRRYHGFTRDEVRGLIATAVESSWLDADDKKVLRNRILENNQTSCRMSTERSEPGRIG